MKFTYSWLKDFVEVKIPARSLADKLTMAGLEVTSLEEKDGDFVFEIEITSNRPDWLSVVGIAREVAAITGSKIKVSSCKFQVSSRKPSKNTGIEIKIEDKKDCSLYTAKIIRDVLVGPSPEWLKKRLELIGCRSINNVVDITNYVLFTFGEPLHAFDLDKLNTDSINIRRARAGEKITTIDEKERILDEGVLVIADKTKPVAIAGVMGGKDTEVTELTKNILLEAAIFNPVVIRRARQKFGIQTDSSYRFERGIDARVAIEASWQALGLIESLACGKLSGEKSIGTVRDSKKIISLNLLSINKILGKAVPCAKIKNSLQHLGFKVATKSKDKFTVTIPSFRQDVSGEIDLIEEVARITGYESLPVSLPSVRHKLNIENTKDLASQIKNLLIGLGLSEVITYSLIDRLSLDGFNLNFSSPVEVQNPLSKEQEVLRPTLIPSLSKCVAYNLNQKQSLVNIFEIAKVFLKRQNSLPIEELVLSIALCGQKSALLENGLVKDEMTPLHLKGILENVFKSLGITKYSFDSINAFCVSVRVGDDVVGMLAKLQKSTLNMLDIKNRDLIVSEINLEKVLKHANLKKQFTPLSFYPAILRDISLLLKEDIKIDDVYSIVRENAGNLLNQVKVVDFYKGKQIPAGFKSLTISCQYRLEERTLTEAEVDPKHAVVLSALTEKLGAKIR
ncbi:MAG: phenylalanine--tRNA ligase subunit beta [Candidatus Omnitrophica bacterium]|nr:phenylalanine--tRNA ligase subunit beta [Candidatus Omnitrophota bacterium]